MDPAVNWNMLRTFYVIVEQGGITPAARFLGVSQPSVSTALRKLEKQLGCQLVFRNSRTFELTLHGDKIYAECREMFSGAERIRQIARANVEEERGEVRFLIISNLSSELIDETLRLYHQRYPSVRFSVEVRNSHEIVQSVLNDRVGFGICLLKTPTSDILSTRLFSEEFALFCGCEHHLFGCDTITLRELRQEPFIMFTCAADETGLEPMSILRSDMDLGRRITGTSSNLREVRRMIVAGLGVGLLPLDSVRSDISDGTLWPIRLGDRQLWADVHLVQRPEDELTRADRNFIAVLHEILSFVEQG